MWRGAKIHCHSAETCSFTTEHRYTDVGMDCTRDGGIHQEWPIKTEYVSPFCILITHHDLGSFPRLVVERIFHTWPRKLGRQKSRKRKTFFNTRYPTLVNKQFKTHSLFSLMKLLRKVAYSYYKQSFLGSSPCLIVNSGRLVWIVATPERVR